MRSTSYNVDNIHNTYKKILEAWKPRSSDLISEKCMIVNEERIREHNSTFTGTHCSQAEHYLNNVETIRKPNYIINACKYFLYWLYCEVLKKNLDNQKILKVYKDVLTAYIDGSGKEIFRNYVNFFSEEIIEKFIKLTEMYDHFYKFKEENTTHGDVKCIHATECIRLYNENIKVCEEGNDYDFCYELDNLKESYDTYMMTKEICPHLTRTLESYKLYNPAVVIITPFSILLVISLSLFFFFKFTPFGSIFRKRTKNKNKIPDNLDYATHVLSHTSQRVNSNNKNRQYNISYLSSGQ
ncbi:Plasmodium vivax Vir protein, putative [Plasmodium vivax]|nr:Plasmodium vivax Vir protein, putative [Plasmodium vivax]